MCDLVFTLRDNIKQMQNDRRANNFRQSDSDVYNYGRNQSINYGITQGHQPNHYEWDEQLESLQYMVVELIEDIGLQMGDDLHVSDIKSVLTGVKGMIVKLQGRDINKRWKKWEQEASYRMTYQQNLYDMWENSWGTQVITSGVTPKALKKETKSKIVYTTAVTNRPKRKLKYDVIVTHEVSTFIKKLMEQNKNMEWGVAFTWVMNKDDKTFIIDRIYIMPVDVGGAHVKFVNESEFLIFSELSELGAFVKDIDNKTRFAGIMHSHNSMGSWHSSTDHGTIETYIVDFKSVLSIVWAMSINGVITADIILQSEKEGYELNNFNFVNEQELFSDELDKEPSDLTDRYNSMITTVKDDYEPYKKLLKRFDDTKKYIKIEELYKSLNSETIDLNITDTLKELLL